ncbi:hypothetical protein F5884DRAFT_853725 [Xylogone sp. PMI_703]|nr:hypothetical protein F5884DRAFT_853725 [Xylogone sp. PMI_703]
MDPKDNSGLPIRLASASQVSDAWQLAVETHLSSLSALQRAAFVAPATADDCMNLIAKSLRVRGFSRVLSRMRPLIDPLRRFESVIDVLVQTNGGLCSPIWGPLKFAMMVASDHIETIEKLAKVLQRIVASLGRYSNYETLFKNDLNTQRAIGALYSDLIDLCTRVVKFYSRPTLTSVFTSFDKEFQQVSDNITHHSTEIDWAANAANIEEAQNARGVEEAARSSKMKADVQKWLCPANVLDDLYRYQRDCRANSCDWALEIPEVQTFLSSETPEILRIGGAPGSGKSTLLAFLIGHIMKTTTGDVLYFFCKGTDEKKNRPFQVIRTLISQILARDESLYPWFETLYQQSGQETAESFASLHSSFQLALRNTSKSSILIVIDALDECQEARDLIISILMATAETKVLIKVLITCREDPELLDYFDRPIPELKISKDKVERFVSEYIEDRVSRCKHISKTALGVEVQTKVTQAAAGLWLSARLLMDEIQRLPSRASIARQLQDIPTGIVQLYQQIFSTMDESFSPLQVRLSQQVFLWIDIADFVQVGRSTLDRAILDLVFQAENGGEEVFDSIDLARQLCSPLIELRGDVNNEKVKIEFVHHTAAQFLRMCGEQSTFEIPRILKPQRLKALYRGNTGVWYFEQSLKSDVILQQLRSNPRTDNTCEYFEMAYGLWDAFFLKELPPSLNADEIFTVTRLCDKLTEFLLSGRCLKWIEMAIIINYEYGFVNLCDNAEKALYAAYDGVSSPLLPFCRFSTVRRQFFTDYVYVLSLTGPTDSLIKRSASVPEGFSTRRIAAQLLSLGKQWTHLYHRPRLPNRASPVVLRVMNP